ncbi:MAG: NAD(P)/FAD-dependent oxidoreductase [Gemmatimonadales bacterium]
MEPSVAWTTGANSGDHISRAPLRLHSGAPFFLVRDGLREGEGPFSPAPVPASCDVAIIGAGITGALLADALTGEGLHVVILDRRAPACGSTAASTALLTYEIDVGLKELGEMIGVEAAVRAYQVSGGALNDLAKTAASLPDPCGFSRTSSVCLATHRRHTRALEEEVALRQRHGIEAQYWSPAQVEQTYGFPSHGALHTETAGVLDPVRLTRALLDRAVGRGAVLLAHTAARDVRTEGEDAITVITDRGEMRARWVVYAIGYELPSQLRAGMVALHSTYALVTEPLDDFGPWQGACIVWETARPYHYMRATEDRRVMIGGEDVPWKDAATRDRLMPSRSHGLERQLEKWLPTLSTQTAFVWAGTFGETHDGLPYIGAMRGCPRAIFALGYGGNGITFGAVAARIVADICQGRPNDDAVLFRLDRSH